MQLWYQAQGAKTFSQERLDQLLAPVALYPDSLLTQIFMASTYPLEVVKASNWTKQNKGLKGNPGRSIGNVIDGGSPPSSERSLEQRLRAYKLRMSPTL